MNKFEEMMANAKEADVTKLFGPSKEQLDTLVRDARWISRYRMARAEHGWSQARVAAKLMVSRGKISRFENGRIKALTPAEAIALAYILGIEPGDHPYVTDVPDLIVEHRPDGSPYVADPDGRWWWLVENGTEVSE